MKIFEAKEAIKPLWEIFNQKSPYSSFLQSFAWGDFQKTQGIKVYRLAIEESTLSSGFTSRAKLRGIAQILVHPLAWHKSYLYVPHGPIVNPKFESVVMEELLIRLREIAKIENACFVLFEPKMKLNHSKLQLSNKHIQAETTLILDLSSSKKEILAQMKSKTRYNIRLAKRKGVKIIASDNLEDISLFLRLAQLTSKRDDFRLHPLDYYRLMLKVLSSEKMIELLLAKYKNKYLSAILVAFYGQTATYLHGASDNNYRFLMAPHLLQWAAIKRAKKRGDKFYDFWGITADPTPQHKWAGFTRFKRGFAPKTKITQYPGPYEFVFRPLETAGYKLWQKMMGRR